MDRALWGGRGPLRLTQQRFGWWHMRAVTRNVKRGYDAGGLAEAKMTLGWVADRCLLQHQVNCPVDLKTGIDCIISWKCHPSGRINVATDPVLCFQLVQ